MKSNASKVSKWSHEDLFHTGEDFYNNVIVSIKEAKKSIYIEAHYFDEKYLGKKIIFALLQALERNIEVYLILDGISPLSKKKSLFRKLLDIKGAHIRVFNPLPWQTLTIRNVFKLNQRTHKKLILIDKTIAYIGSYNIDTRQLNTGIGSQNWADCGVKVQGIPVSSLKEGFWDTWNFCKYPYRKLKASNDSKRLHNTSVRLNHHKSWRLFFLNDIINKINQAQHKIWITNPYFVPDHRMKEALHNAHKRGVDVVILIPQKSDLKFFPLINFLFFKSLVVSGVNVSEYLPSILHTKNIIIDQWVMIGSSNLNSRSQKHDWELDIVLSKKESLYELENRFKSDLLKSKQVKPIRIFKKFGLKSLASPLLISSKYFL